jgi:copper chaperone CopZ
LAHGKKNSTRREQWRNSDLKDSTNMKKQIFKIIGMHCTACAINIDGELEDTPGVTEARTNYAKSLTEVTFDPDRVKQGELIAAIKRAGYDAVVNS